MTRYFMRDTPLYQMEQMMMTPPIVLHVTPPFLMIFYHHLVDLTTALKCYYSK